MCIFENWQTFKDWLKDYQAIIGIMVSLIVVFLTHYFTKKRERNKEEKRIENLKKLVFSTITFQVLQFLSQISKLQEIVNILKVEVLNFNSAPVNIELLESLHSKILEEIPTEDYYTIFFKDKENFDSSEELRNFNIFIHTVCNTKENRERLHNEVVSIHDAYSNFGIAHNEKLKILAGYIVKYENNPTSFNKKLVSEYYKDENRKETLTFLLSLKKLINAQTVIYSKMQIQKLTNNDEYQEFLNIRTLVQEMEFELKNYITLKLTLKKFLEDFIIYLENSIILFNYVLSSFFSLDQYNKFYEEIKLARKIDMTAFLVGINDNPKKIEEEQKLFEKEYFEKRNQDIATMELNS